MRDDDHQPRHFARPSTSRRRRTPRRRRDRTDRWATEETWADGPGDQPRREGWPGEPWPDDAASGLWDEPKDGTSHDRRQLPAIRSWSVRGMRLQDGDEDEDGDEGDDDAPQPGGGRSRWGEGEDDSPARGEPRGPVAAGDEGDGGDGDDDDRELGDDDDGEPPWRRLRAWALPAWAVPVALGVGAVVAATGAMLLDDHATADAVGAPATPTTPVLSARRVPEVLAAPVADRRITADLQSWIAQSPSSSCLVVESGNDALFAHNPAMPLAGASTQKVITASALLQVLGPDARLETVVSAASEPSGGVVAGDLYVVGGGDPLLTSPVYAESQVRDPSLGVDPIALADAIVGAGVDRIEGSVVGDGSRYDGQRFHPSWPGRFRGSEVGPVGALTVNDGLIGFDGRPPPAGAAADDPAVNAATVVTDLLRLRGVTVVGAPRAGSAPSDATEVATFASPTVREIVAEMLTDSDDQTAEMAFKELGYQQDGDGSWEGGTAAVTTVLDEAGVDLEGLQIVEGSGLSTANRLTCQLQVDLLTLPETGQVVVDGLAVAGETGTLEDRWNGSPVEGRLLGKTGTLNSVTALSGRVTSLQGGALTFAYVANVPEGQALPPGLIQAQDRLGEILVSYPRDVDVAALVPAMPTPRS